MGCARLRPDRPGAPLTGPRACRARRCAARRRGRAPEASALRRVSAVSQSSNAAGSVSTTGIALGWIGATIALGAAVRKANSSCSPSTGADFGPRSPAPAPPDAGEGEQRPAFVAGEPHRRLARLRIGVFAEGVDRHEAAVGGREPAPPERARRIAQVGDQRRAGLRRAGHAPARQDELAAAARRRRGRSAPSGRGRRRKAAAGCRRGRRRRRTGGESPPGWS